jgi:predicted thioredoxin/glutaredoxin
MTLAKVLVESVSLVLSRRLLAEELLEVDDSSVAVDSVLRLAKRKDGSMRRQVKAKKREFLTYE